MNKYQEALDLKFEKTYIIDLHLEKFPKAQEDLYKNEEFKENINKIEEFSNKYKQTTADALQELVDKATPIFDNSCNAIFDVNLLYEAIDWKCQNLNKYCHKKYKLYLYNGYPCISIGHEKIRIHQLLGEFIFGKIRKGYVIHHIDGNKLNNCKENLVYISNVLHTQIHHKDKDYTPTLEAIKKARKTNYRKEITKENCVELRKQGLTISQIAKKLNCCCNTIRRRLGMKDYENKNNFVDWSDK